ncbi:hypothetical protein VULLAG_LOCUS10967 [Vulpes lagopus]
MKPKDGGPTAAPDSEPADVPLLLPRPRACPAGARLCGPLRKQKSLQHCRFFVLRADRRASRATRARRSAGTRRARAPSASAWTRARATGSSCTRATAAWAWRRPAGRSSRRTAPCSWPAPPPRRFTRTPAPGSLLPFRTSGP